MKVALPRDHRVHWSSVAYLGYFRQLSSATGQVVALELEIKVQALHIGQFHEYQSLLLQYEDEFERRLFLIKLIT
jgi:hypothetical protein